MNDEFPTEPATRAPGEYAALVSLAEGYLLAIDRNHRVFRRFRALMDAATVLMILAPVSGFAALLLLHPKAAGTRLPIIRAVAVWAEYAPGLHSWGCGFVEKS
jgi:hypothetical protein